jgi:hypothetical protein
MIPRKLGSEVVNLNVGAGHNKRVFVVHKKILCDKSDFFNKMFASDFKEAKEGVIELPEDNPAAVSAVLDMLIYHNTIRNLTGNKDAKGKTTIAWDPVEVYSLAQKWCFPAKALDDIMDKIVRHHFNTAELPSLSFIDAAYEKSQDGSKLRMYSMDSLSYALQHDHEMGEIDWPSSEIQKMCSKNMDFLRDYIASTRVGRDEEVEDPRKCFSEPCKYHEHQDDKECRHAAMTARDAGCYKTKEIATPPASETGSVLFEPFL